MRSADRILKWILVTIASVGLTVVAAAHPANIPVARARVQPDGSINLEIRFDVLAFVLEENPMTVLDPPMNALLDGPLPELQTRLDDARKRFEAGLTIAGGGGNAVIDSYDFPTAKSIHAIVDKAPKPRLPVMAVVSVRCHLSRDVRKTFFSFPEVLGTLVLTTEFPYQEPISESVEPGTWSRALMVPTQEEVDASTASMKIRDKDRPKQPERQETEPQARKSIQRQYDAWSKAYMSHDVDTLLSILTSDYSLKTAKGAVIFRAEYEQMLNIRKQKHDDTTRYSTEISRITLHDGVAAIWARETTTNPKKNVKTGKMEPVSYQHDYVDVWVYSNGKWLLKSTVTQKEQTLPPTKA